MPLLFCLFLSAMAASLWFNRLPENIQETLGILGRVWTSRPQCRLRAEEGAFYSVFVRRAGLAGRNDALQPGSPMSGVIGCRIFYGHSAFCAHC